MGAKIVAAGKIHFDGAMSSNIGEFEMTNAELAAQIIAMQANLAALAGAMKTPVQASSTPVTPATILPPKRPEQRPPSITLDAAKREVTVVFYIPEHGNATPKGETLFAFGGKNGYPFGLAPNETLQIRVNRWNAR